MRIDFTTNERTLFTGINNGRRMSPYLIDTKMHKAICIIKIREDQIVTSSFFLGLLENILKHHDSVFSFKMVWDYSLMSIKCRDELERTLTRYYKES